MRTRAVRLALPVLLAASIVLTLDAAPAWAQPSEAEEKRRTELFLEGRKLADEGRFAEAVAPFREVIAIRSAPKALIALALVERELTHLLEARDLLEQAVSDARKAKLADDEDAAKRALAELLPTIPRIDLEDADAWEGLEVYVDDKPAVRLDGRILVDPGSRVVRLEAPGHAPQRESIVALVGRATTIYVGASGAKGSASADADGGPWLPRFVGPAVVGGTGVLALGIGFTLMGLGSGDQSEARDLCGGGTSNCPASSRPLAESGADKIIAGDVVAALGGALLIGGGVWLTLELLDAPDAKAALAPTPSGFVVRF